MTTSTQLFSVSNQNLSKPAIQPVTNRVQVRVGDEIVADSRRTLCLINPDGSVVYFVHPEDVQEEVLYASSRHSICEYKGVASHYHISTPAKTAHHAARSFVNPHPDYSQIRNYITFNPGLVDECLLDGQKVKCQPGDFIGKWIV